MRGNLKKAGILIFMLAVIAVVSVAGNIYIKDNGVETPENEAEQSDNMAEIPENTGNGSEASQAFADKEPEEKQTEDRQIDFDVLRAQNPDIFAWIHIPGTAIDYPVLQSGQSDTFYEDHNADGEEDDTGAVYIELANLTSMCDFNTVLHGKAGKDEDGLFADLYKFAEPDFFEDHEYMDLYLDGNVLTYEIFAAYERENTSLIRTYDFTYLSGCRQFLEDLYGTRDMGMNLREGWENVNEYNYIITLTTQKEDAGRQFVVTAVLIQDAAGTINRIITE